MDNKKITSENYDEMKENNHQKVNQDKNTKKKTECPRASSGHSAFINIIPPKICK